MLAYVNMNLIGPEDILAQNIGEPRTEFLACLLDCFAIVGCSGGSASTARIRGDAGSRTIDEDQFHLGHLMGAKDADALDRVGDDLPAVHDEVLAQRVAEAHVDRAFHLALEQNRVHHLPNVMGRDDFLDPPLVVENHDLRSEAVGEVRLGLRDIRTELGRVVADPLAEIFSADQVLERLARIEVGLELL